MKLSHKTVTTIPLDIIWTDQDEIQAKRTSYLTGNEITQFLKEETVQFVVADIGPKLKWIDKNQCFDFWKADAKKHLINDINKIDPDSFLDEYGYVASLWIGQIKMPIILLEKFH